MAYTTEEQDFQSFTSKVRQYFPLILTFLAVASASYAGINWYKNYQNNQVAQQYAEFDKIMTLDNDKDSKVTIELILDYLAKYPEKELGAIAALNKAKTLVEEKKYEEALKLISAIGKDNKFSPELISVNKAKLLLQLGRGEEGIKGLDAISEESGDWYVNARVLAGDIYFNSLNYSSSYAEYLKAKDYLTAQITKGETDSSINVQLLENQVRYVQSRINIVQSMLKTSQTTQK